MLTKIGRDFLLSFIVFNSSAEFDRSISILFAFRLCVSHKYQQIGSLSAFLNPFLLTFSINPLVRLSQSSHCFSVYLRQLYVSTGFTQAGTGSSRQLASRRLRPQSAQSRASTGSRQRAKTRLRHSAHSAGSPTDTL